MNNLIKIKKFIKNFLLFSILTPDELMFVIGFMDTLELGAGETLFKEGDAGDFMCIVLDGELEIIKETSWLDEGSVIVAGLKQLIHEIHRRSLWQVLAIYGVASWVIYEVVEALTSGLGLPQWFPAFAIVDLAG